MRPRTKNQIQNQSFNLGCTRSLSTLFFQVVSLKKCRYGCNTFHLGWETSYAFNTKILSVIGRRTISNSQPVDHELEPRNLSRHGFNPRIQSSLRNLISFSSIKLVSLTFLCVHVDCTSYYNNKKESKVLGNLLEITINF